MESAVAFSSTPPPSVLPAGEYEVFLSFRGPDVRNTFADHLYTSLSRAEIRTFRDEEELRKGEGIAASLFRAIPESKIYIPILTEQYASSKWCLQELAQMVECWKLEKGHLILPVFYFVDPRDVRHQLGPYQKPFEQHAQKHSLQTVTEWKEALQEVGQMKGWHVTESDGQGAVVEQVLAKVESHLRSIYLLATDELVGIDIHVEEVMKLLNLGGKVVGIHGMGGIGKTTLSKVVYNKICTEFDRGCFLEDVRETLTKSGGAVCLQNMVISSILKDDYLVRNVSEGIKVIKERVCKHKVLIVLDDVDDKFEFDQILGKLGDFSLDSRFILTTRDKRVLDFLTGCRLYEVGEMSGQHSLQLFSKHAFGMDQPPEAVNLCKEFVKVAAGLPLALKVIGSLLFRRDIRFWQEKLIELHDIPSTGNKVQGRLKISYNELTHSEKQIFLDIACLFIGGEKELPCHMWGNCNLYPESGIQTLTLRSLIKLDEGNKFWMHDHIRDLGRAIVREEDVQNPFKRSRIWSTEDALDMLRNGEGNDRVEVLTIDLRDKTGNERLTDKEFQKLSGLRYLQVMRGRVTGDFSKILPNLRWLQLGMCDSIPTDLNMKKLAILDLTRSDVKDDWRGWNQIKTAHNLKVIILTYCHGLKRAPKLSPCRSLELIDIGGCSGMTGALHIGNFKDLILLDLSMTNITKLAGDIGMLQHLHEIDARNSGLRELPVGIDQLSSLKILYLGLKYLIKPYHQMDVPILPTSLKRLSISPQGGVPNLIELKDLEYLHFRHSPLPQIPGDIWELPNLQELSLYFCRCESLLLETHTSSPAAALPSSLTCLNVQHCGPLMRLPCLANLKNLTVLKLRDFGVPEIRGLGELRALEIMEISDAPNLINLDGLENLLLLKLLSLDTCVSLKKLPNLGTLIKLQKLVVFCCLVLVEIKGLGYLRESLSHLEICSCPSLGYVEGLHLLEALEDLTFWEGSGGLPEGEDSASCLEQFPHISNLNNLKRLDINRCRKLTEVTWLERLASLESLNFGDCLWIRKLPNLSGLWNLKVLNVSGCTNLVDLTGIEKLGSLERLDISHCSSIKQLPNLSGLTNLEDLHASGCTELTELTGIERLESLKELIMSGCRSLKELGNLSGLGSLELLNIRGCTQLTDVNGLEELENNNLLVVRMDKRSRVMCLLNSATIYGMRKVNRFTGFQDLGRVPPRSLLSCLSSSRGTILLLCLLPILLAALLSSRFLKWQWNYS